MAALKNYKSLSHHISQPLDALYELCNFQELCLHILMLKIGIGLENIIVDCSHSQNEEINRKQNANRLHKNLG